MRKYCSRCQTEKSLNDFHKHKGKKDGLRVHCKECVNARNKEYKIKNRDKVRAYNNSDRNRILNRERNRKYRHAHREDFNARYRRYYKTHGNPSYFRRIQMAGVPSDGSTRQDVWIESEGRCYLCNKQWDLYKSWHVEHVIPISRGGSDLLSNKAVACPECNMRKGRKLVEELDVY